MTRRAAVPTPILPEEAESLYWGYVWCAFHGIEPTRDETQVSFRGHMAYKHKASQVVEGCPAIRMLLRAGLA